MRPSFALDLQLSHDSIQLDSSEFGLVFARPLPLEPAVVPFSCSPSSCPYSQRDCLLLAASKPTVSIMSSVSSRAIADAHQIHIDAELSTSEQRGKEGGQILKTEGENYIAIFVAATKQGTSL